MGKLSGALDMHIHGAPDIVKRKLSDIEIVRDAITHGMYGVVLKTHLGSTAERAALMQELFGAKLRVFGGITLNNFIGGFNPLALQVALMMGAKIVWMPTFTAKTHLIYERKIGKAVNALSNVCANIEGLSILDDNGKILDSVVKILNLVAKHNAVLGCGHIGMEEVKALIPVAKACGVKKIVYNHPNNPINAASLEEQQWLVSQGVLLERCVVDLVQGLADWKIILKEIRETGVENNIFSTDLGQFTNIAPTKGLELAHDILLENHFNTQEISKLICENPRELLLT
ncbi:DUF6282 family protein [Megasphaera stantonii]|uniref:Cytosolic protein n=1 Tax=Megasphaera stantonii TaxID=2144175 RepID=A0A346AYR5_9FIRM|nr:DUF6282 family protein [Megasphaera stantonii]AXL21008.1 hypothetical protein DKB62_05195 [Megasphaera stantonii]